jgi:hypothetical protein
LIKVENIEVFNFEGALRGMRNPLESWEKSDSYYDKNNTYIVGEEDMKLALKLVKAGTEHAKFTRQIFVSMDIIAPDYWWKEYSTYKIGTTENSTSTMHRLTIRLLTEDDFSWDKFYIESKSRDEVYYNLVINNFKKNTLNSLNELILRYQETKDKRIWRAIIQNLPMGFNYLRTCSMNYQVLRNMYFQRRHHKLSEWRDFCRVIEKLPYSELITIEK